jgi:1-acyl-sn-glycerol-3-phosphate acyltransferase
MSWPSWAWWLLGIVLGLTGFVAALPWIVQGVFRVLLWPRYGFVVVGREHVPKTGPALLASNHVSWIDGFILAALCPRNGKALINASYIDRPILRWVARRAGLIPVPTRGPHGQRAAIEAVRAAFDRGEVVGIFPEAQLSRNGLTGPFYRGIEVMMKGREDVPVVPVFLDNLWGSVFSFSGGRFFRKWPKGWRRRVVIVFGPPLPPPITAFAVRQGVLAAGVRAIEHRPATADIPETINLALPHLDHPELGRLTVSTADYHKDDVHQIGQKPGTVGQAAPGVALRAVDDEGTPLPPEQVGRLQALQPGRPDWVETGVRGRIDRDGFVTLA